MAAAIFPKFRKNRRKITCPYCLTGFSLQEALFRCMNPTCSGRGFDNEYAQAHGSGRIIMGRVLMPGASKGSAAHDMLCSACLTVSTTRLCPHCHYELPAGIEQSEQQTIAVIGGQAAGKTHYIAASIHHLMQVVGPDFAMTVTPLGDESQEYWTRDFYTPLFERHTALPPARFSSRQHLAGAPLIVRLRIGKGDYSRILNMSLFDTADENMTGLATHSTYSNAICRADGIIFLLDPLQMPGIRQKLDETDAHLKTDIHLKTDSHLKSGIHLPASDPAATPEHIVQVLRALLEREKHISPQQKIKTPVAFVLSKIDTLATILDDPGSPLLQSSNHRGMLDLNELQSLHTDISHRLRDWLSPSFCDYIENNFADYHYFGVSSLGHQPDAHEHIDTVSPRRVEEPLLWLLYRNRLIYGQGR